MDKSGVAGIGFGVELTSGTAVGVNVVRFGLTWVSVGSDGVKLAAGVYIVGVSVSCSASEKPTSIEQALSSSIAAKYIPPCISNKFIRNAFFIITSGICGTRKCLDGLWRI